MTMRLVLPSACVLLCATSAVLLTRSTAAQDGRATEPSAGRAEEELGRFLFWDPLLSGDRDVACATCHHPDFAYADGRDLSLGAGAIGLGPARVDASDGRIPTVKRNSQTILNTAFNGLSDRRRRRRFGDTVASADPAAAPMFWDNRIRSLEAQALEPIKALEEMRGTVYAEADAPRHRRGPPSSNPRVRGAVPGRLWDRDIHRRTAARAGHRGIRAVAGRDG